MLTDPAWILHTWRKKEWKEWATLCGLVLLALEQVGSSREACQVHSLNYTKFSRKLVAPYLRSTLLISMFISFSLLYYGRIAHFPVKSPICMVAACSKYGSIFIKCSLQKQFTCIQWSEDDCSAQDEQILQMICDTFVLTSGMSSCCLEIHK